ncbi:MAG: HEAT repeat domain-containing protein [Phycisphaerales bacterium]|nr:MAG: HEAT repeat domain-containing protein [Phycisphaerales bacterium]
MSIALGSCRPTAEASFDSAEPAARNAAIVEAAAKQDRSAIPDLVRMLESDDPATRLLAIQTLTRLTGNDLGYDARDSRVVRSEAVERWRAWVEAEGLGKSR